MSGSNTPDQPGVYGEKGIPSTDNIPGSRYGAVGWFDSLRQELWLFGGYDYNESMGMVLHLATLLQTHCVYFLLEHLNDLWRYSVNNNTWTWMSGSNTTNQLGFYGEKGNGSTENVPGARSGAVGWYDELRQELWLFGGYGCGNDSSVGA